MKKFLKDNKSAIRFIFFLFIIWRLFLFLPSFLSSIFVIKRIGFLGPIPWSNFDGVHYLSIAQHGYFQYEQAFFPLFPFLIRCVSFITFGNYVLAGMLVVYTFLLLWLFVFYKLLLIDYKENIVRWMLIGYLFSPTSFFFVSLYTETFFLFFIISAFLAARKEKWILAGICIGLASSTKFVGIFLLPALFFEFFIRYRKHTVICKKMIELVSMLFLGASGVIVYMLYLWRFYADPLFFIHAQPAFGANRSGGNIILLPQVLFRYIKIFISVSFTHYDTWIALLEFCMFLVCLFLLCFAFYKRQVRSSYLIFSLLAVIGPTLTGSLSSIPRYILVAFPMFILFGSITNTKIKICFLLLSSVLLLILTSFFLQGYFIA